MTSIIKKLKNGNAYYYAVQSKRVNGKPRIVWQKYLGSVEAIKRCEQNSLLSLRKRFSLKPGELLLYWASPSVLALLILSMKSSPKEGKVRLWGIISF